MLIKHYTVDFKIFFFILFLMLFSNSGILTAQSFVKNGSFEKHKISQFPISITPSHLYETNQLMKCIGYCAIEAPTDFVWPPVGDPCYCDFHPSDQWFGGWYWATRNGSSDYFHLDGEGPAKSPDVSPRGSEKRYPYGYPSPGTLDSAFTGIRMKAFKQLNEKGTYKNYKEYLQSKLEVPITCFNCPKLYEVKFYVSRSRTNSRSLTQLCAFFSDTAVVNPYEGNNGWSNNLAFKTETPIEYVTSAQICSDYPLDQTADINGYGGWQEIKGYLEVPAGVTYNYITIGNFQDDYDIFQDLYGGLTGNTPNVYEIYYFIDEVSIRKVDSNEIVDCTCRAFDYDFEIEKQAVPTDSTKCCYDFQLTIRDKVVAAYFCDIRRFKIVQGTTVLIDSIAPYPYNYFNGYTVNGSFCIDDFPVENNKFSIQLFTDADTLMQECTKDFTLNCFCVCSEMSDMINRPGGPKFQLQKADSSESGRCCWDIIMTNSSTNDSNACKFDLSNKYLIIESEIPSIYYDFLPDEFTLVEQQQLKNSYRAPSNFILNHGESKRIGTICSKGIPTLFNEVELNFVFSNENSSHESVKCATALSRKISCDSVAECCDLFTIVVDSIYRYSIDSSNSYCGTYFRLDYNDTPDYCNFDDLLEIEVTSENGYTTLCPTLRLSDVIQFPVTFSPFIFFHGYAETFCIKIKNLRTEEECEKCIVLGCNPIILPQYDLHRGLPDIELLQEDIKIIPNPTDDIVDIYFNSEENSESEISIYSLMGEEMLTKRIKVRKGKNSTRLSTFDLPPALYYLKINIQGKIMTKPVIVAR